ncbi:hypothetical protein OSCI_1600032 [Kamptonema sp. PCC 6506]|nr:hypothetical protein [Kamptonema formosum]CBN55232.1 hypothetical protein OSCI_1600032 [Kamptonema sp. PCC 6506]
MKFGCGISILLGYSVTLYKIGQATRGDGLGINAIAELEYDP